MKFFAHSQHCEDIFVHRHVMNVPVDDLSIVEVGAFDGLTYSNSIFFEEVLGAQPSLLVEPSPVNAELIRRNRPKSSLYQLACSEYYGITKFSGDLAVSGISEFFTPEYARKWKTQELRSYNVITVPMQGIVDSVNSPYIDLLSLDVQGAELSCLKSLNFIKPIGCIVIELEGHKPAEDEYCRNILLSNSYTLLARLHISEVWVLNDYSRKSIIFDPSLVTPLEAYRLKPYSKKHFGNLKGIL